MEAAMTVVGANVRMRNLQTLTKFAGFQTIQNNLSCFKSPGFFQFIYFKVIVRL